jgi:hypothetical protein
MRGTAAGEPVVSQANTADFEAGYERAFGPSEPQKGRWIWDDRVSRLVPAEEYTEPTGDGRVMVLGEAHYDGLRMTDGTIVDSRRKYREYLKATGCAVAGDYSEHLSERKAQKQRERHDAKDRRETIGRSIYEVEKGYRPQRRYEDEPF